jgi:hypothetical protein
VTIATDQLTRALLDMAAQGLRTHCSDPQPTICGSANMNANDRPRSCCVITAQSSPSAETQPSYVTNAGAFWAGRKRCGCSVPSRAMD